MRRKSKRVYLHGLWGEGIYALVSEEDYNWVSMYRWYRHWDQRRSTSYAITNMEDESDPFAPKRSVLMHRFIMGDKCDGFVVAHKDNNGLHNQRWNLRVTSQKVNYRQALRKMRNG